MASEGACVNERVLLQCRIWAGSVREAEVVKMLQSSSQHAVFHASSASWGSPPTNHGEVRHRPHVTGNHNSGPAMLEIYVTASHALRAVLYTLLFNARLVALMPAWSKLLSQASSSSPACAMAASWEVYGQWGGCKGRHVFKSSVMRVGAEEIRLVVGTRWAD